jgi:hypothetical protein
MKSNLCDSISCINNTNSNEKNVKLSLNTLLKYTLSHEEKDMNNHKIATDTLIVRSKIIDSSYSMFFSLILDLNPKNSIEKIISNSIINQKQAKICDNILNSNNINDKNTLAPPLSSGRIQKHQFKHYMELYNCTPTSFSLINNNSYNWPVLHQILIDFSLLYPWNRLNINTFKFITKYNSFINFKCLLNNSYHLINNNNILNWCNEITYIISNELFKNQTFIISIWNSFSYYCISILTEQNNNNFIINRLISTFSLILIQIINNKESIQSLSTMNKFSNNNNIISELLLILNDEINMKNINSSIMLIYKSINKIKVENLSTSTSSSILKSLLEKEKLKKKNEYKLLLRAGNSRFYQSILISFICTIHNNNNNNNNELNKQYINNELLNQCLSILYFGYNCIDDSVFISIKDLTNLICFKYDDRSCKNNTIRKVNSFVIDEIPINNDSMIDIDGYKLRSDNIWNYWGTNNISNLDKIFIMKFLINNIIIQYYVGENNNYNNNKSTCIEFIDTVFELCCRIITESKNNNFVDEIVLITISDVLDELDLFEYNNNNNNNNNNNDRSKIRRLNNDKLNVDSIATVNIENNYYNFIKHQCKILSNIDVQTSTNNTLFPSNINSLNDIIKERALNSDNSPLYNLIKILPNSNAREIKLRLMI